MKRFHLFRYKDCSGVSGVGVVAEGVEFSDGTVAMKWLSKISALTLFQSIYDVEKIHGHRGSTEIVWIDNKPISEFIFPI
jgi:hypothetical protein